MSGHSPEWREFEQAVAAFAGALDPTARIKHDIRLPDRHHRGLRQRDVWIEAKLLGHFPVSALVSCKRFQRKLHSGDIDAFNGELTSSHARVGVVYSYSGFSKPALAKAKVLGISCCRLYRRQAPEIPEVLTFIAYCCMAQVALNLSPYPPAGWKLNTWNDLFDIPISTSTGTRTLLDELMIQFHENEMTVVNARVSSGGIPSPFQAEIVVPPNAESVSELKVVAMGRWKFYRAKLEAHELNGSYEFTGRDFKGEIAFPWIDRLSSEPGPGWERLDDAPVLHGNYVLAILSGGNTKEALIRSVGSTGFMRDYGTNKGGGGIKD